MTESIRVQITQDDIEAWLKKEVTDPIIPALTRATHTPWRLAEMNYAVERVAPYRATILRCDILTQCRAPRTSRPIIPFEFETELISPFCD